MVAIESVKSSLLSALAKSLEVQQPVALATVERLRRVHPQKTPADILKIVERTYLGAVALSGAGAGFAGAVPGVGVPAALTDVVAFTEATVLYVLTAAEIHGLHAEDLERRQALVLTVVLGDSAAKAFDKAGAKVGPFWAKKIVEGVPLEAIKKANKVLGPNFVTRYGTRQGVLVLAKQVPMGIGAAVGGGGNLMTGRAVVASARTILGKAPGSWPASADPVETAGA